MARTGTQAGTVGGLFLALLLSSAGCNRDPQLDGAQGGADSMTTGGPDGAPAEREADGALATTGDGSVVTTNNTSAGGNLAVRPGCYDCSARLPEQCPQPAGCTALEQPCKPFVRYDDEGWGGGTGVVNPPTYENPETGGGCIVEALRDGTPGRYTVEHNPGHQFSDTRTITVLGDRRAIERYRWAADNVSGHEQSARNLRQPAHYASCLQGDADQLWMCLLEPLDDDACYTEQLPSCP